MKQGVISYTAANGKPVVLKDEGISSDKTAATRELLTELHEYGAVGYSEENGLFKGLIFDKPVGKSPDFWNKDNENPYLIVPDQNTTAGDKVFKNFCSLIYRMENTYSGVVSHGDDLVKPQASDDISGTLPSDIFTPKNS